MQIRLLEDVVDVKLKKMQTDKMQNNKLYKL